MRLRRLRHGLPEVAALGISAKSALLLRVLSWVGGVAWVGGALYLIYDGLHPYQSLNFSLEGAANLWWILTHREWWYEPGYAEWLLVVVLPILPWAARRNLQRGRRRGWFFGVLAVAVWLPLLPVTAPIIVDLATIRRGAWSWRRPCPEAPAARTDHDC